MCASKEHPTNADPTMQEIEPQRYQPPPPLRPQQPMQPSKAFGQIPSQTILSPQESMSNITLRSGKELAQQQSLNLHSEFFEISYLENCIDCDCTCIELTKCPNCIEISNVINSLQASVITTNKLQVEQKEELLWDLKKLGDFYEHLVKHSTLRFLLKKPQEDMALELSRWMRRRLPKKLQIEVKQGYYKQYPQLDPAQTYELKSCLIHLFPKFHGLAAEDPHKHLKEFHVVCSTMRPQGILEDYIKMKAFPFSLDGAAKDWLYLQPVLFNTWGDMNRMFLEKFFPASRTTTIKNEIYGIRQHIGETLHEYWERFNKLCATCLTIRSASCC
ncbi:hypothetical protein CR513_42119, partial [Mucuna pruriens]